VTETNQRVATGYTLVLPPGWCRIPLRQGTSAAIREMLNAKFKHLPRDTVAPYRAEIERRLKQQVAESRSAGGVDMYFPVDITPLGPLPASFVVSEIRLDPPADTGDPDPSLVVASLAADALGAPGTRIVDIDGASGLRAEELVAGAPGAEFSYATRSVKYTLPMPGAPGRWLLVMFATPGAADPAGKFAGLLVELFDAIMGTFRWTEGTERQR
jgi:hypothetical protein